MNIKITTRKYLDELGCVDRWDTLELNKTRTQKYEKKLNKLGVCPTETWNLDSTMSMLLYERLMQYIIEAERVIDLDDKNWKYTYKGETYTLREIIKEMIERLQFILWDPERINKKTKVYKDLISNNKYIKKYGLVSYDIWNDEHIQIAKEVWEIYSEIFPALWW